MRKYLACLIAFSVYAIVSTAWFTTSMLLKPIAEELGINMQQSTLITNSIVLAKIFGAAFAGFLFYKFGLKWGYFIGSMFISFGAVMGYLDKLTFIKPEYVYYIIVGVRFFTGLGSAVALAALVPIAQKHFANDKKLGTVISININSNLVGSLVAFWFTFQIVAWLGGWQNTLAVYGYLNIILLVLWIFVDSKDERPVLGDKKQGFKILGETLTSKVMWGMILYYLAPLLFLNSMSLHVVGYITGELKASIGDEAAKNLTRYVLSLISIVAVITPFVGGWLKKKGMSFKKVFVFVNAILILSMLNVIFGGVIGLYVAAILGGSAFGLLVPFLFALPMEMSKDKPEFAGYIVSGFWSVSFAILFVNNQLIAYIYDNFKTYIYGFWYVIALLAISPLALKLISKETK